jgi:hypothetical protein
MMQSADAERFERRLTEEISGLRAEMYRELQALRLELHDGLAALRQELSQDISAVRQDMATMRADILKWSFVFWIGQVATIAALLSFMLRPGGR